MKKKKKKKKKKGRSSFTSLLPHPPIEAGLLSGQLSFEEESNNNNSNTSFSLSFFSSITSQLPMLRSGHTARDNPHRFCAKALLRHTSAGP